MSWLPEMDALASALSGFHSFKVQAQALHACHPLCLLAQIIVQPWLEAFPTGKPLYHACMPFTVLQRALQQHLCCGSQRSGLASAMSRMTARDQFCDRMQHVGNAVQPCAGQCCMCCRA